MKEVYKKSAVPYYIAAASWLAYALIFPLYKLWHLLIIAVISIVAFLLAKKKFPGKAVMIEEKIKKTGDEFIDALIEDKREYTRKLRQLNEAIKDPVISGQIDRMEAVFGRIIDHIIENPKKAPQIRRFMDYYLPTAIKLLTSYEKASAQGVRGENIENTMNSVKEIMGTIARAFDKQLDSLFEDVALDISTDIVVLESLMESEGLTGNDGGKKL